VGRPYGNLSEVARGVPKVRPNLDDLGHRVLAGQGKGIAACDRHPRIGDQHQRPHPRPADPDPGDGAWWHHDETQARLALARPMCALDLSAQRKAPPKQGFERAERQPPDLGVSAMAMRPELVRIAMGGPNGGR
jgi:hypothetical protein